MKLPPELAEPLREALLEGLRSERPGHVITIEHVAEELPASDNRTLDVEVAED